MAGTTSATDAILFAGFVAPAISTIFREMLVRNCVSTIEGEIALMQTGLSAYSDATARKNPRSAYFAMTYSIMYFGGIPSVTLDNMMTILPRRPDLSMSGRNSFN